MSRDPSSGMAEQSFTNCRVVLPREVLSGGITLRDGMIAEVFHGSHPRAVVDCEGDYLIPGLIELHTDHLEFHFKPRPKVLWPVEAAVVAHDAQIATSGITTVFDALRVGTSKEDDVSFGSNMKSLAGAIGRAKSAGVLRADHLLHLRCELACEDTVAETERFLDDPNLRLISLMDHTPGQRQFTRLDKFKEYYGVKAGMSDAELETYISERLAAHERLAAPNRRQVVALARAQGIPLASHDDATGAHVEEAAADGVTIAEFPTTADAAELSRRHGMHVLMGAPNVVRGGSHSGNVSAQVLAEDGLLDILSSDYVPFSLLQAAFGLPQHVSGIDLPAAVRLVTQSPALATGLEDRGEIAVGKRADLVQVRVVDGLPVVRSVWRQGQRVA